MKLRDLPPLAALRAFAAFAQTGSVVAAGDALGVSHAAISQQLRALETHLGTPLLERSGRALRLTASGEIVAQGCMDGFSAIERAIDLVTGAEAGRALHISPSPSFASAWLMPRLVDFRARHPDINILINPTAALANPSPGGIDLAIRYGTGGWPGLQDELLMEAPLVVVAAPALIAGRPMQSLEALSRLPWLEELGTSEGTAWLRRNGFEKGIQGPYTQLPGNLMLDGARDGQGIAVTVRLFVEADLQAGRLVVLREEKRNGAGYYLVTRPGIPRDALRAFIRWIRKAAAAKL